MIYKYHAAVVLDTSAKAVSWRNGIKNKALSLRTAGTIPAWLTGTGKIEINPYFIGGSGTFSKGMAYPPPPLPEPVDPLDPPVIPPKEPTPVPGGIMFRVDVFADFGTVEKATQCGEAIAAAAMIARANDTMPAWIGAGWSVQEINETTLPDAVSEALPD